ncbi:MAG: hypothetical protein DRP71_16165, partial [Verrucomicrobia bacterium]
MKGQGSLGISPHPALESLPIAQSGSGRPSSVICLDSRNDGSRNQGIMSDSFTELKNRLAEISDLTKIGGVLGWDQRTMMAPKGAPDRAEQTATLSKVILERFTDPRIGQLLDELKGAEEDLPYDSDDASLIRYTRREYHKALKVPTELQVEMSRGASMAQGEWAAARAESDFNRF